MLTRNEVTTGDQTTGRRKIRWHILVFLAPAILVYTALMIVPLFSMFRVLGLINSLPGVALVNLKALEQRGPRTFHDGWLRLANPRAGRNLRS